MADPTYPAVEPRCIVCGDSTTTTTAPPSTTSTTTTSSTSVAPKTPTASTQGLPVTGGDILGLGLYGAGAVTLGALLARRKRARS